MSATLESGDYYMKQEYQKIFDYTDQRNVCFNLASIKSVLHNNSVTYDIDKVDSSGVLDKQVIKLTTFQYLR